MQNLVTFGDAIAALKQGKRVARQGWNGKGMFVYLNRGSFDYASITHLEAYELTAIDGVPKELFDEGDSGTVTRIPNLSMKSATGATVTGWLASQTDILAEDWTILD